MNRRKPLVTTCPKTGRRIRWFTDDEREARGAMGMELKPRKIKKVKRAQR